MSKPVSLRMHQPCSKSGASGWRTAGQLVRLFCWTSRRLTGRGRLSPQLVIDGRGQLVEVAEERYKLPSLNLVELFAPRRHTRPANPVPDDVEILVFCYVRRIHRE